MSDTYYDQGTVKARPSGKIAGTNYVNQLRDWVERRYPLPQTGNADPPLNVASSKLPSGQYSEQVLKTETLNQIGWGFIRAHATLESL